jgi:hypothetical protein
VITALIIRALFSHKTILDAAGLEVLPRGLNDDDWILYPNWPDPVQIIDQNWAVRSIAVRLGPAGGIVVWPMRDACRRCLPPNSVLRQPAAETELDSGHHKGL